jgi:hypothetical protein
MPLSIIDLAQKAGAIRPSATTLTGKFNIQVLGVRTWKDEKEHLFSGSRLGSNIVCVPLAGHASPRGTRLML